MRLVAQKKAGLCGKCLVIGHENFEHVHSRGDGVNREEDT